MSTRVLEPAATLRDPDLVQELEAARGSAGFWFKQRELEAKQADRDRLNALSLGSRRRALAQRSLDDDKPTLADLRHIHSALAICGLPYERQPLEVRDYGRAQGNMAIDVVAGSLRDDKGNKHLQPLPFGPKARLVLMHLSSEAVRQKSPTIEISESFTAFVRDMGYSDSGGKRGQLTAFKEQLNALASCTIKLSVWEPRHVRTKTITPIEDMELWLPSHPSQRSLWPSTVTFSEAMYDSLKRHAMPLNVRVIRSLASSARKLDLYFWLGWRMHNIEAPLHIGWSSLFEQFGGANKHMRYFKRHLSDDLSDIRDVLAKLPVRLDDNGLTLLPADPDVLALPVKRVRAK